MNGAVPIFPQYISVLSQTVFRNRLSGGQQTMPQLIMDMHFRGKNLFIQIDFHDAVQQGFLPLLNLLQPDSVLVQFLAEPVCNFRRLNLNDIGIKKPQLKTPDRAVGEAEEQLLVGAFIFIVRIFWQPGLG